MPKIGMEEPRRRALIDATIREVGARGGMDVTVGQIARRAGMSSALAHHYFGNKEKILLAAMRHILSTFGDLVRAELMRAQTPMQRLNAILDASLDPRHFDPETVAAWLAFYVQAQQSPEARRLLRVYALRLHSNLLHELKRLTDPAHATRMAQALSALIDGFYIRHALQDHAPNRDHIIDILRDYVRCQLTETDQP